MSGEIGFTVVFVSALLSLGFISLGLYSSGLSLESLTSTVDLPYQRKSPDIVDLKPSGIKPLNTK